MLDLLSSTKISTSVSFIGLVGFVCDDALRCSVSHSLQLISSNDLKVSLKDTSLQEFICD